MRQPRETITTRIRRDELRGLLASMMHEPYIGTLVSSTVVEDAEDDAEDEPEEHLDPISADDIVDVIAIDDIDALPASSIEAAIEAILDREDVGNDFAVDPATLLDMDAEVRAAECRPPDPAPASSARDHTLEVPALRTKRWAVTTISCLVAMFAVVLVLFLA